MVCVAVLTSHFTLLNIKHQGLNSPLSKAEQRTTAGHYVFQREQHGERPGYAPLFF